MEMSLYKCDFRMFLKVPCVWSDIRLPWCRSSAAMGWSRPKGRRGLYWAFCSEAQKKRSEEFCDRSFTKFVKTFYGDMSLHACKIFYNSIHSKNICGERREDILYSKTGREILKLLNDKVYRTMSNICFLWLVGKNLWHTRTPTWGRIKLWGKSQKGEQILHWSGGHRASAVNAKPMRTWEASFFHSLTRSQSFLFIVFSCCIHDP